MKGAPMNKVMKKLGVCQNKLQWWSRKCFEIITKELVEKRQQRRRAKEAALSGSNAELMVKLKCELFSLLMKEEKM